MADAFNIKEEIVKGTKDVFSTMLMVELESSLDRDSADCHIQSNLTSMIGLGGGLRGMLAVHCPAVVAKAITSSFLGMDVEELDEDVKDAIGEIANMVAGNLKISYATVDIQIELAIPTSVVGESFTISGIADAERVVIPLTMPEGTFWIELLYVINNKNV